MGTVIGIAAAVLVVGFIVVAEVSRSAWVRDFKLGRALRRSDNVIRSAAVEMQQTVQPLRDEASWRDW